MNVLFVNNAIPACGVHEYGNAVFDILAEAPPAGTTLTRADCESLEQYFQAFSRCRPEVVIWNYQPLTLPWVSDWLSDLTPAWHVGIAHDVRNGDSESVNYNAFHTVLSQDPTCVEIPGRVRGLPRPLRTSLQPPPWTGRPTIGSFGFVYGRKRFDTLTELICRQYSDCLIRFHFPTGSLDPGPSEWNARQMAERCRRIVRSSRKKIDLEITHDYKSRPDLIQWLAGNSINALWYDEDHIGVSSCPDAMIECGRPFAVNRSPMFRHLNLQGQSIYLDDRPLPMIEADGVTVANRYRAQWNPESVRSAVWSAAIRRTPRLQMPPPSSNRILRSTREWEDARHSLTRAALHVPSCPIKSWDAVIAIGEMGDGDILDLGCQSSVILPNAQRLGIIGKKFGVDFSPGPFNPGIVPLVGEITRTRFPDSSFDYITCLSTIEHGVDLEAFARETGRLLRRDGKLIVSFDYWPTGRDTAPGWSLLDQPAAERFIALLASNGLALTGDMDWTCGTGVADAIVGPPWSPIPNGYTFAIITCRKMS